MLKATLFVDQPYLNNEIFNTENTLLNRDDCLRAWRLLRDALSSIGFDIATQDIHSVADSSLVIYSDVPKVFPEGYDRNKSMVILFESAVVKPANWTKENHDKFRHIFTWNDDYVDGDKYRKINFAQPSLEYNAGDVPFAEKKMCVLMAGNKKSKHPNEAYSERVRAISWFERNHPESLDLFGNGWDKGVSRRISTLRRKLAKRLHCLEPKKIIPVKTYRGKADNKADVLRNYRFSICYENATGIPGYITEKIFDCFISGVVPVYLGPPNIDAFIPRECYISKLSFKSYKQLYRYLEEMNEETYDQYQRNISSFISSNTCAPFTCDYFVAQIVEAARLYK